MLPLQVVDRFDDGRWRDPVLLVVRRLDAAPAVGLADRALHRARHIVGVQDHVALDVSGGATDGLDQRPRVAQVAFFVGVENRDERHLREIEAFTKQVDTDQHVEDTEPQVAQNLDPLQRVDVRVQVVHLDAHLAQIIGQVLRHLFGQHGDQRSLLLLDALVELAQQVVHLPLGGPHLDGRIDQPGRPDDDLDRLLRALLLVGPGGGRDVDHLLDLALPFRKRQRPVVEG